MEGSPRAPPKGLLHEVTAMLCTMHGAGRAIRFDAVEALKR